MYNKELTIFSVFHKPYPQPVCDFIKAIPVGNALSSEDFHFLKDDTGENISVKNQTFCELTALYWIWKNTEQIPSAFIGLSHYRRYFCLPEKKIKKKFIFNINRPNRSDVYVRPLSVTEIEKAGSAQLRRELLFHLNCNELIVARKSPVGTPKSYNFTIKDGYIFNHLREDWLLLEAAIKKVHPDYFNFALKYFESATTMHCFNMFIGNRKFLIEYCEWLFPILNELEHTVRFSEYPYQRRVIGFMAERLFNLYISRNEISTVSFPVLFFE